MRPGEPSTAPHTGFVVVQHRRVLERGFQLRLHRREHTRRDVVLTGACGIPATAKAVSANVTVTGSTAAGNLVAFPADLAQAPGTNTLSFGDGQTRANNAMLLFARDGSGKAAFTAQMPSGTVHLIVDVNGWWE